MKVLIVINNLLCGGAQKSLLSFLNCLEVDIFDLDLLVLNPENAFFDSIPGWVSQIYPDEQIKAMHVSVNNLITSKLSIRTILQTLQVKINQKLNYDRECDEVQNLWKAWKKYVPVQKKQYDLAISYVDGFSNYYVVDKVKASKKILWIHNEYEKLGYNADFDREYFRLAHALVTISEACVASMNRVFPEYKDKTYMLYNLSSPEMIKSMGRHDIPKEYINKKNIIVSVGRLNEQKGFDLAVEAATIMKFKGIEFNWFIIGEGEEETFLHNMIVKEGLEQQVQLLGLRKNPYTYIYYANVFVQPSRYEGKSIVLDEAKILCKPIVATNYTTVYDSIIDGENGTIVEMSADKLADGIIQLLINQKLKEKYVTALKNIKKIGIQDVNNYLKLFYEI